MPRAMSRKDMINRRIADELSIEEVYNLIQFYSNVEKLTNILIVRETRLNMEFNKLFRRDEYCLISLRVIKTAQNDLGGILICASFPKVSSRNFCVGMVSIVATACNACKLLVGI